MNRPLTLIKASIVRHQQGLTGRESGQAIIEYILVLIITVIIILGLLYQFSAAFKSYVESYFGNYIACLLEVGELPGNGGVCESEFKAFNIADGKPLVNGQIPSSGSGGSGGGSSNRNGKNGSEDGQGAQTSKRDSKADGPGKGESLGSNPSGGGGRSTVGRVGGFGRNRSTPVGNVKSSETDKDGKATMNDSLLGISPTSTAVGNASRDDRRRMTTMNWGYFGDEEEKERASSRPPVAPVSKPESQGGASLRAKVIAETARRGPAAQGEANDEGFSFGNLIQYLLIAAIILAIVIFFGGQILQISKSWEKN